MEPRMKYRGGVWKLQSPSGRRHLFIDHQWSTHWDKFICQLPMLLLNSKRTLFGLVSLIDQAYCLSDLIRLIEADMECPHKRLAIHNHRPNVCNSTNENYAVKNPNHPSRPLDWRPVIFQLFIRIQRRLLNEAANWGKSVEVSDNKPSRISPRVVSFTNPWNCCLLLPWSGARDCFVCCGVQIIVPRNVPQDHSLASVHSSADSRYGIGTYLSSM